MTAYPNPRSRHTARTIALVMFLSAFAGSLSACSGKDDASEPATSITMLTYDAYVLPDGVAEELGDDHQIDVNVESSGDAGTMLTKAAVTARGNALDADVMFGVDTSLLSRAVDSDLFVDLPDSVLAKVPATRRDVTQSKLIPIDIGQVCVIADKGWFAERKLALPTTIESLADPKYKGLLVVEDPAASSPGLTFLAGTATALGDGWMDYWERLKANDVRIAADWSAAYEVEYTVSGGTRPLVVSYGSSPPAEVVFGDDPDAAPSSTVLEPTCIEQVEYAGVLASSTKQEPAIEMVTSMLGSTYQEGVPLSNFVFPLSADTPLPDVFARYAVRAKNPIVLDPVEMAMQAEAWLKQWRQIFG